MTSGRAVARTVTLDVPNGWAVEHVKTVCTGNVSVAISEIVIGDGNVTVGMVNTSNDSVWVELSVNATICRVQL